MGPKIMRFLWCSWRMFTKYQIQCGNLRTYQLSKLPIARYNFNCWMPWGSTSCSGNFALTKGPSLYYNSKDAGLNETLNQKFHPYSILTKWRTYEYRKVTTSNTSCLEAHACFFLIACEGEFWSLAGASSGFQPNQGKNTKF